jgi:hypothetical protein
MTVRLDSRLRRLERHATPQEQEVNVLYVNQIGGSEREALRVPFTPTGNLRSEDGGPAGRELYKRHGDGDLRGRRRLPADCAQRSRGAPFRALDRRAVARRGDARY